MGSKRRSQSFDLTVHDMVIRVTAPEELYEEARAAALGFWEQLQSYGIRDRQFRTSKRPVEVPEDAPPLIREIAEAARVAGMGPVFASQGAITDHIGRFLARRMPEVLVSNGGDYFVLARRRFRLTVPSVNEPEGQTLAMVIRPELGAHGVFTSVGRPQLPDEADGLVVVASSCMLAGSVAAGTNVILRGTGSMDRALDYLQRLPGVFGAMVVQGRDVGVAGSLELAA